MASFRSLFAGLPGALLLFACAHQPQADGPSRFAATPPTIDGQATDWGPDSLRFDPETKLQYQVLNDQRAVYVRLKAAYPMTQARLLHQGFTVWLDTTGRNQQQFGVRFTLPREPVPAEGTAGAPGPGDRHALLSRALAGARDMELLNYKGNKEPTYTDTQSPLGVKLAAALDAQDNLVYELAVPLRLLYRRVPVLASGQRAVVGVTVIGNRAATGHDSNSSGMSVVGADGMGNGAMGGGRGRGGYGGGGMRGGMPGGYGGPPPLVLKTTAKLSAQ